jgi:hypothetical protein
MDLSHPAIQTHLREAPYPLLFVTVSGAHLYGFASPDSDYDLRGAHILPAAEVLGLRTPRETVEVMDKSGGVEVDLVTHDVKKFFLMLLKNNGYVLEQIYSPLVVVETPEFVELRQIAAGCITRNHRFHYLSFAQSQWKLVTKGGRPTAKGLLYTYRVLLAGIHLMRTGRVESNLVRLNEETRLPYIDELIQIKLTGPEKQEVRGLDLERHEREYLRLAAELAAARETSNLPDEPSGREALNDLLVRLRLKTICC